MTDDISSNERWRQRFNAFATELINADAAGSLPRELHNYPYLRKWDAGRRPPAEIWAPFLASLPDDERAEVVALRRTEHLEGRAHEWAARATGLPIRSSLVRALAMETAVMTDARRAVAEWASESEARSVLLLLGGIGTGKTAAALELYFKTGGAYRIAEEVARLRGSNFGPDREKFTELLTSRDGLVIVDEVGVEGDGAAMQRALHELVDSRVGSGTAIIVSNLTWGSLSRRLDPRTVDRLREVGTVVEVAGESMRGAA